MPERLGHEKEGEKLHTALAQDQMVIQIDSDWFSDLSYITKSSQNHHNHRSSRVRPYIRI